MKVWPGPTCVIVTPAKNAFPVMCRVHLKKSGQPLKTLTTDPNSVSAKKRSEISPRRLSETAECFSMLTSLLAAGQDAQLCQSQPPHPTLTQLGSPFSPCTFPTLSLMKNKPNHSLPLPVTVQVFTEVSWFILEMKKLYKNMLSCRVCSLFWKVFFRQDQLLTLTHTREVTHKATPVSGGLFQNKSSTKLLVFSLPVYCFKGKSRLKM